MSGPQPHILFCSFDVIPYPRAWARRVTEYLPEFKGRASVVILSLKSNELSHIERYHGARLLRVPVGTGDLPSQIEAFERAVRRQLESEEYSLVHVSDAIGGSVLLEQKAQSGFKLVYEALNAPSVDFPLLHPDLPVSFVEGMAQKERACLAGADAVLVGSRVTRSWVELTGVDAKKVRLLPAPVSLELPPEPPPPSAETNAPPLRVLYLGAADPWEELDVLFAALLQARSSTPIHLRIAGALPPARQAKLEADVLRLNLRGAVEVLGQVPHAQLTKIVSECDVGVLPYAAWDRNQRWGDSLFASSEFYGLGRPLLAADLALTRGALPDAATVFYPPGNVAALSAALVSLGNAEQRAALGKEAREHAAAHLDAKKVRKKLWGIYEELLGPVVSSRETEEPVDVTARVEVKPDPMPEDEEAGGHARPTGELPVLMGVLADEGPGSLDPEPPTLRDAPSSSGSSASSGIPTPELPPSAPRLRRFASHHVLVALGCAAPDLAPTQPLVLPPVLSTVPSPLDVAPAPKLADPVPESPAALKPQPPPLALAARKNRPEINFEAVNRFWKAQIVLGYCPPESVQFDRPPPPTNFPGRDPTAPAPEASKSVSPLPSQQAGLTPKADS